MKNYWNTHLNKINITCCCPAPAPGGRGGRKRKANDHDYYSKDIHHHQDNCNYGSKKSKMISSTESTQIENNSRQVGSCRKEERSSSSSSIMTATNYPHWLGENDYQSLNFDCVDIDLQYSTPSSSWVQYYLPTVTDNNATSSSTFVFDDEPFIASMDSFLLFEAAFGYAPAAAAAAATTQGMQSSVMTTLSSADDPHSHISSLLSP